MVFSAPLYTSSTVGTGIRDKIQAVNKHDIFGYALYNAPIIGLAGVAAGVQEAYYAFEKMPPAVSRQTWRQAAFLGRIIGRKALLATGIGAVFCTTEAAVEHYRGKHDFTSGIIAGLAAGTVYGGLRPMPQPIAWPLTFAAMAVMADIVSEKMPDAMKGFRYYGPLEHRPSWGDPAPPRPPILDTGASNRPAWSGHFWRGA